MHHMLQYLVAPDNVGNVVRHVDQQLLTDFQTYRTDLAHEDQVMANHEYKLTQSTCNLSCKTSGIFLPEFPMRDDITECIPPSVNVVCLTCYTNLVLTTCLFFPFRGGFLSTSSLLPHFFVIVTFFPLSLTTGFSFDTTFQFKRTTAETIYAAQRAVSL